MEKITLKNVSFKYQKRYILDKVNLEIQSGKISALIGPNGSGKTTILKIISGLKIPNSGEVLSIKDANPIKLSRTRIGFLFDEPLILPYLSSNEYLKFVSFQRDIKNNEGNITKYLKKYNLPQNNELLKNYSKGMIQKVSLISLLICNFSFIILDEPFTFLDSDSVQELVNDLLKLREEGVGILITSHQFDIIRNISDVVYKLEDSQIKM